MPLPITRGSSVPLYPFTRTLSTLTRITAFENASEQRFAVRPPLMNFVLPFSCLAGGQLQSLRGAHTSAKGQLTTNLSLVLGAITYSNLAFLDDRFDGQEYEALLYRGQFKLRQTVAQSLTANANGNVFPAVLTQYPFTRTTRSQTYVQDQESGPRYAWGQFATALTGFPTGQLFDWELPYAMVTDAELASLEQFFVAMNGRLFNFSFTDPEDGTPYTNCRFDQDDLDIQYQGIGQTAVTLKIAQTG